MNRSKLSLAELDALGDQIGTLGAQMAMATHQLLTCIRKFDDAGGPGRQGARTCAHWLSWRVGMGSTTAREHVRVAHALGQLPRIDEAMKNGVLSYSKVRAITRAADETTEERFLSMAKNGTAAQLERICRYYRQVRRRAKGGAELDLQRYFRHWETDDGMVRIEAQLAPEEFAQLQLAFGMALLPSTNGESPESQRETSAESSEKAQQSHKECVPRPSRIDALVSMAESYLARGSASRAPAERAQLFVHLQQDPLRGPEEWRVTLDDGTRVSAEAFRRLTDDISIVAVRTDETGNVLDIGRRSRVIPPAIVRALHIRDHGTCRFPGCLHQHYLHSHHVHHWIDGGETKLDNLVTLCSFHHRLIHEGEFRVVRENNAFVFNTPEGRELSVPVVLDTPRFRADVDPQAQIPNWFGETTRLFRGGVCVAAIVRELC